MFPSREAFLIWTFLALGVHFFLAFEENSVIVSLPKITANATSTTVSQGTIAPQTSPSGTFSSVLAQAKHTSTAGPAGVTPPQGKQAREDGQSGTGHGKNRSNSMLDRNDDGATQVQLLRKPQDTSTEMLVPSVPTAPAGEAKIVPAEAVTTTAAKPNPVSVTSTVVPAVAPDMTNFSFANASPFVSTVLTTTSPGFAGTSESVADVSDGQPNRSLPNSQERSSSTNPEFSADTAPVAVASTITTGVGASINPAGASTVAGGANVSTGRADAPQPPNDGSLAAAANPIETARIFSPIAHVEETPQSPVALPIMKSEIALPKDLQSIPNATVMIPGKPDMTPVVQKSVSDAASADTKPVAQVVAVAAHPAAHKSVASSDSADPVLAASSHSTVTKNVSAIPLMQAMSAPQLLSTRIEASPQADGAVQTPNKLSGVTTAPSQVSTKTVASGDDSKPQNNSASNQESAASAGAELQNVPQPNVTPKGPDAFATNLTQPTPVAAHTKLDTSNAVNELGLNKAAVHASDPEIALDKPGATTVPGALFQSAKLAERLGQSELRVGIQAGEFGQVDIRTSMARNQFTAEISVERGELSKVMAAELPSLQTRLSEQHLPVTNIILQNQSSGGSAGSEHGSRQSQTMQQIATLHKHDEEASPVPATGESNPGTSRLDVHM